MGRLVVLDLASDHDLARDLVADGVFAPGVILELGEECELVLRNGDRELQLRAKCVWVDGDRGVGLQLLDCDADFKLQIATLVETALPPADEEAEPPPNEEEEAVVRKIPRNVHERLRGLTLAQQIKVAQTGELTERIVLERLYHKTVWEALLRNPRITAPEVARIARMGALPRPQIETIVGNGAWLQVPEVRRALLANPRLGTDQILRVLRLLPKHELKLASIQTAYPFPVRDQAKRMIREMQGERY